MVEQHDIEKSTLHPKRLWISKIEFTITSKEPLKNTWSNCWKHDIFWRTQFFWSTIPSFFVVVWRTNSPQKLCANDVQTLGTFFRHSNSILKTKDVAVKIHKNKKITTTSCKLFTNHPFKASLTFFPQLFVLGIPAKRPMKDQQQKRPSPGP